MLSRSEPRVSARTFHGPGRGQSPTMISTATTGGGTRAGELIVSNLPAGTITAAND